MTMHIAITEEQWYRCMMVDTGTCMGHNGKKERRLVFRSSVTNNKLIQKGIYHARWYANNPNIRGVYLETKGRRTPTARSFLVRNRGDKKWKVWDYTYGRQADALRLMLRQAGYEILYPSDCSMPIIEPYFVPYVVYDGVKYMSVPSPGPFIKAHLSYIRDDPRGGIWFCSNAVLRDNGYRETKLYKVLLNSRWHHLSEVPSAGFSSRYYPREAFEPSLTKKESACLKVPRYEV